MTHIHTDNGLAAALVQTASAEPERVVISNPAKTGKYRKISLTKTEQGYLAEKLTDTQAFHESVAAVELADFLRTALAEGFSQLNAWDANGMEYSVKITKSGNVLTNKKHGATNPSQTTHNRQKSRVIPEGSVVPPLIDMGVITKDGRVVQSMYDKYKQINRFIEIIDDVYGRDEFAGKPVRVVDFGCGKSYLTFVLYYYFTEIRCDKTEMLGLDLKEDVIKMCAEAAQRYGYTGLNFTRGDIAEYAGDFAADILISLHACDTATDYALFHAVKNDMRAIFAVPCCQHELNGQMEPGTVPLFSRYGVLKERTAAILTDAIRANLMTCMGYKAQILEFIDFEHTPKNIMLRAVKSYIPREKRETAYNEVMSAVRAFGLRPTLLELLTNEKMLLT